MLGTSMKHFIKRRLYVCIVFLTILAVYLTALSDTQDASLSYILPLHYSIDNRRFYLSDRSNENLGRRYGHYYIEYSKHHSMLWGVSYASSENLRIYPRLSPYIELDYEQLCALVTDYAKANIDQCESSRAFCLILRMDNDDVLLPYSSTALSMPGAASILSALGVGMCVLVLCAQVVRHYLVRRRELTRQQQQLCLGCGYPICYPSCPECGVTHTPTLK